MKVYAVIEITNCWADIQGVKEALAVCCEQIGDVRLADIREADGPEQLRIGDVRGLDHKGEADDGERKL